MVKAAVAVLRLVKKSHYEAYRLGYNRALIDVEEKCKDLAFPEKDTSSEFRED